MDDNKIDFQSMANEFKEYIDFLNRNHEETKKEKQELMLKLQNILMSKNDYLRLRINRKKIRPYNDILYRNFEEMGVIIHYLINENITNRHLVLIGMKWNLFLLTELKDLKIEEISKDIKEMMKEYKEDAPFIKDLKEIDKNFKKQQEERKNYRGVEHA